LSKEVERLTAENKELNRKYSEIENELVAVKAERDDYAATVDEFIKDHKLGKQHKCKPEQSGELSYLTAHY
jgi:uncharacterized coiled-coil DUF342 family protein